jgi:ribose 5-phosphate isomerase RpiB
MYSSDLVQAVVRARLKRRAAEANTAWRLMGRACLIHENFSAHQGVEDDDLNQICFGGLGVGHALAWELMQTFLAARFIGAERFRRLAKVANLENKF